jgi:hypothetical protein
MPVRHAIWKVAAKPEQLAVSSLATEQLLESMIVAAPSMLSDEWLLIGRQVDTGHGGRIDLLGIAPDGSLVLIELKRNRTPRDVVAQALDYAGWVKKLETEDIARIYARFAPGKDLAEDFRARFGGELDEETLNESHQIIVVATELDDSTERIVNYLSEFDIPINILFFQVFKNGGDQFLSRTWLLDPVQTQLNAATTPRGPKEPWNGEFYVSYGHDKSRSWVDALKYGFVSAGGGDWYSSKLKLLNAGDRIWVKAPGYGFVGVGRVTGPVQAAGDFQVMTDEGERPALQVLTGGHYHKAFLSDPERREYFVPVQWLDTAQLDNAFDEIGLFGNQNTVCKPKTPKWRHTVERLKERFPKFDR